MLPFSHLWKQHFESAIPTRANLSWISCWGTQVKSLITAILIIQIGKFRTRSMGQTVLKGMASYHSLLVAKTWVYRLLLQNSNILLLVFKSLSRCHVSTWAKEPSYYFPEKYNSTIKRLAWDTNIVIIFSKETNKAAMILQSCMWEVWIAFKEFILYCRVLSKHPFIIIFWCM